MYGVDNKAYLEEAFQYYKGWTEILQELDNELSFLCPKYEIVQIKEKFGKLRFYFDVPEGLPPQINEIMWKLAAHAEMRSSHICMYCGDFGRHRTDKGWWSTLCEACFKKEYPDD